VYGHSPDQTYNHWRLNPFYPSAFGVFWGLNEARTLEMETQVYNHLRADLSPTGKTIPFASIRDFLVIFNHETNKSAKIAMLNGRLLELGYESLPSYDKGEASQNRDKYLCALKDSDYPGVILSRNRKCGTTK
jgi:hypothetical protein